MLPALSSFKHKSMPSIQPASPYFSSGPCKKHPGWAAASLSSAATGRSHRSDIGLQRIQHAIALTREVLEIPSDYRVAVVPGSTTGAVESALWNLLGERGIDTFAWDVFGGLWVHDLRDQLKFSDLRIFSTEFGVLPDLSQYEKDRDVVFTWNGTTSGVCVPNLDWIPDDRSGLTLCDATSSIFAIPVTDWSKLDVMAFSWQKALGGEAGHGMLVFSPRAFERLQNYIPPRPLPRVLRLWENRKKNPVVFEGMTINTPSLLCVEDAIKALEWAKKEGGQKGLSRRCQANFAIIDPWVKNHELLTYMAQDPTTVSRTGVCLKFKDSLCPSKDYEAEWIKKTATLLADKKVAYEIKNHRSAPPSFRIWCGPTVEKEDVAALLPWIDWALAETADINF